MMFYGYCNGASTKPQCANFNRDNVKQIYVPVDKNGAIITGWQPDGTFLLVIDIDLKKGESMPVENLDVYSRKTLLIRSGGGGYHAYFKINQHVNSKKYYDVKFNQLKEIDIKGHGSTNALIFAPGSFFPDSGHKLPYSIIQNLEPLKITTKDFENILKHYISFSGKQRDDTANPNPTHSSMKTLNQFRSDTKIFDDINQRLGNVKNMAPNPIDPSGRGLCKNGNPSGSPSFQIYPGSDSWHCFSCQKGGDKIQLFAHLNDMTRSQACKELTQKFELTPEKRKQEIDDEKKEERGDIIDIMAARGFLFLSYQDDKGHWLKCMDKIGGYYKMDVMLEFEKELYEDFGLESEDVNKIKSKFRAINHVTKEIFYYDDRIIHFKNGLYLIDKHKLISRENDDDTQELDGYNQKSLYIIPHNYNPNARYPTIFMEWLYQRLEGDWDKIDLILKGMGYTFTTNVGFQKLFILRGGKRTGKGTFLNILHHIIGEDNTSGVSVQRLSKRFGTSGIVHKILNMYTDLPKREKVKDDGVIKTLIDAYIDIEEKGGAVGVKVKNITHHWFSTQYLPKTNLDEAFCRRWAISEWNKFITDDELKTDWENIILQDENEIEGIIKLSVDAYHELQEDRIFRTQTDAECLHMFKLDQDRTYQFIQECCTKSSTHGIEKEPNNVLYEAFQKWKDNNDINDKMGKNIFTRNIEKSGFIVKQIKRKEFKGRIYSGVVLNDDFVKEIQDGKFDTGEILMDNRSQNKKIQERSKIKTLDEIKIKEVVLPVLLPKETDDDIKDKIMELSFINMMNNQEIADKYCEKHGIIDRTKLFNIISEMRMEKMLPPLSS